MEKAFELTVKVRVVLDDPEATEQTVRFLLEEDLRDKGWDADVEMLKSIVMENTCDECMKDAPSPWCCRMECGEHEFCRDCEAEARKQPEKNCH